MKWPVLILVALILLIPANISYGSENDEIFISSADEFMKIGSSGYPLNGNYVQTKDFILNNETINITVKGGSNVSVSVNGTFDETTAILNSVSETKANGNSFTFPENLLKDSNSLTIVMKENSKTHIASVSFEKDDISSSVVFQTYYKNNFFGINGTFTGTYDGNGFSIRNIHMISDNSSLFSKTSGAVIRDLELSGKFISYQETELTKSDNVKYNSEIRTSSLVNSSSNTLFERITVSANVVSLINDKCTIVSGSNITSDIDRTSISGGITAESRGSEYLGCIYEGNVVSSVSSLIHFDCLSVNTVNFTSGTNSNNTESYAGGFIGISDDDKIAYTIIESNILGFVNNKIDKTAETKITGTSNSAGSKSSSYIGGVAAKHSGIRINASEYTGYRVWDEFSSSSLGVSGDVTSYIYSGGISGHSESGNITSFKLTSKTGMENPSCGGIYYGINGGLFGSIADGKETDVKFTLIDSTITNGHPLVSYVQKNASTQWHENCWIYPSSYEYENDVKGMYIVSSDGYVFQGMKAPWTDAYGIPSIEYTYDVNNNVNSNSISFMDIDGKIILGCNEKPVIHFESTGENVTLQLKTGNRTFTAESDSGVIEFTPEFNWNTMEYESASISIKTDNGNGFPINEIIFAVVILGTAVTIFYLIKSVKRN